MEYRAFAWLQASRHGLLSVPVSWKASERKMFSAQVSFLLSVQVKRHGFMTVLHCFSGILENAFTRGCLIIKQTRVNKSFSKFRLRTQLPGDALFFFYACLPSLFQTLSIPTYLYANRHHHQWSNLTFLCVFFFRMRLIKLSRREERKKMKKNTSQRMKL